jgi:hypothetical protein
MVLQLIQQLMMSKCEGGFEMKSTRDEEKLLRVSLGSSAEIV